MNTQLNMKLTNMIDPHFDMPMLVSDERDIDQPAVVKSHVLTTRPLSQPCCNEVSINTSSSSIYKQTYKHGFIHVASNCSNSSNAAKCLHIFYDRTSAGNVWCRVDIFTNKNVNYRLRSAIVIR